MNTITVVGVSISLAVGSVHRAYVNQYPLSVDQLVKLGGGHTIKAVNSEGDISLSAFNGKFCAFAVKASDLGNKYTFDDFAIIDSHGLDGI